jgi:hypothetical protein
VLLSADARLALADYLGVWVTGWPGWGAAGASRLQIAVFGGDVTVSWTGRRSSIGMLGW